MSHLLNFLEKKFGRFAISNLTYYLIIGQVLAFVFIYLNPDKRNLFYISGDLLLKGDWWRIVTFLFLPLSSDILFTAFIWYIYYLYGTALETQWGSFRYLLYLFISIIATILLALIFPEVQLSNSYIYTSLFLAFAYLHPNFILYILFILPLKVKWLALVAWIFLGVNFLGGSLATKATILFSIINFLIFFGEDLWSNLKSRLSQNSLSVSKVTRKGKPNFICAVCGTNEIKNPDMEILYCSDCNPGTFYCGDHLQTHSHKK